MGPITLSMRPVPVCLSVMSRAATAIALRLASTQQANLDPGEKHLVRALKSRCRTDSTYLGDGRGFTYRLAALHLSTLGTTAGSGTWIPPSASI